MTETPRAQSGAASVENHLLEVLNFARSDHTPEIGPGTRLETIFTVNGIWPEVLIEAISSAFRAAEIDQALVQPEDDLKTMCEKINASLGASPGGTPGKTIH